LDEFVHDAIDATSVVDCFLVWTYALQDGLGSVRAEIDAATLDVNAMQNYAPYGEVTTTNGTPSSPFGFTGEQTDPNGNARERARVSACPLL